MMGYVKVLTAILLAVVGTWAYSRDDKKQVLPPLTLHNTEGQKVKLNQPGNTNTTVYVLLSPECPISQQCTGELIALAKQYSNSGILFYAVFPGSYYSNNEVKSFGKKYGINFPLLMDTAYTLTKLLHGSITPSVFVVSTSNVVLYYGAIDNAYRELGRKNARTTAHYLADALQAVVNGKSVAVPSVKAVGCLVEFKNDRAND